MNASPDAAHLCGSHLPWRQTSVTAVPAPDRSTTRAPGVLRVALAVAASALLTTARPPVGSALPRRAAVVAQAPARLDGLAPLVRAHAGAIAACLPASVTTQALLRVGVEARVTSTGDVRDVRVGPASELSPLSMACIAAVLERLRIPPPSDGTSHVVRFALWRAGGGRRSALR